MSRRAIAAPPLLLLLLLLVLLLALTGGCDRVASFFGGPAAEGTVRVDADARDDGAADAADGDIGPSIPELGVDAGSDADMARPQPFELLRRNPFGDGTAFAYIFPHGGWLFLGPSQDGATARSMSTDGAILNTVKLTFVRDPGGGGQSSNKAQSPYPSIGSAGCAKDTIACGPNNENGRGLFSQITVKGSSWIVIAGAAVDHALQHIYMTTDTGSTLTFRFVDLAAALGSQTRTLSAIHSFADRIYAGFVDESGKRPYLVAQSTLPNLPGIDAVPGSDVEDLVATSMVGLQAGSLTGIDAITDFNDRLYIANGGAWWRANVVAPSNIETAPSHWTQVTPSSGNYSVLSSVGANKRSELTPADRAVPAMVTWGGRLYAARNTTSGPQLWVCDPALSGSSTDCDFGDWRLAARDGGNGLYSRFDNTALARVTLLAATKSHLYVGFDSLNGFALYRTSVALPAAASDFRGDLDCVASDTNCEPLGKHGFGKPDQSRILSSTTSTLGGGSALYLVVGDGTAPLAVYRVAD
ncbi:MAG: hypothetical protein KC503_28565 [Myxococcales bacterium]|nr:hypothetical protein [Myxococcales bacterium]